jgi:hypothetical protein
MYQSRDVGINKIKARDHHRSYGMGFGIIIVVVHRDYYGHVSNRARLNAREGAER